MLLLYNFSIIDTVLLPYYYVTPMLSLLRLYGIVVGTGLNEIAIPSV